MPDQETIKGQLTLLNTLRQRLRIQLDQQGKMGVYAPAYLQLEIDDARAQIAKIKAYLRRYGYIVENNLEDGDEPAAAVEVPMSSIPGTPPAADVFVSYHPADKAWVRGELLPRLDRAGLRYLVDYRDFAIGASKIVNIENAVASSRHTLIVVTPDWLASDWNSFQGLLASSADPAGVERKLLPLILKPARLPARIAYLEAIDLTDEHERAFQMDRLIRGLTVKAPEPAPPSPSPVPPPPDEKNQRVDTKPPEPPSTADFVIITALEEEREAVLRKLPGYQRHDPSHDGIRVYYSADLPVILPSGAQGSYRVIVLSLLSMGRVQAATATSDAIRQWHPRYVLLVGIAGGVAKAGVKIGDILISDQIADYELQRLTPDGPEVRWQVHQVDPRFTGAVQNFKTAGWQDLITVERPDDRSPKCHIGTILTGDKVIAVDDVLAKYASMWPKLIGVEMEAGGAVVAAFQTVNAPGFFMVRGVSDLANAKKSTARVKGWRPYACDVAAAYTIALLKSGPVPLPASQSSAERHSIKPGR